MNQEPSRPGMPLLLSVRFAHRRLAGFDTVHGKAYSTQVAGLTPLDDCAANLIQRGLRNYVGITINLMQQLTVTVANSLYRTTSGFNIKTTTRPNSYPSNMSTRFLASWYNCFNYIASLEATNTLKSLSCCTWEAVLVNSARSKAEGRSGFSHLS